MPFDVKGGEMKDILPSMPKGEIVGNMATTEMTQLIKVVIDGNRLCVENRCMNTEAETQTLQHQCEHRCCNTNANCCNTNANTDAETQLLKHRHKYCNSGDDEDGQGLSLMAIGYEAVKVDNTHKRYWNIEAKDAETQMLNHRC